LHDALPIWWRAARRRWAWSTPATHGPSRGCGCWRASPRARTRRSSIRWRGCRHPTMRRARPSCSGWLRRRRRRSSAATASARAEGPHGMFSPEETTAIALSLKVAVAASLGSLPLGVAVAWLLARRRFVGKGLVDALVHLPLVLPPVVVGYALLVAFGHGGPVGRLLSEHFGITLAFRWTGAALASAIMGF